MGNQGSCGGLSRAARGTAGRPGGRVDGQDLATLALLFDLYGGLLTAHQRRVFRMRHHLDLSLAEIAGSEGISRQAVLDLLRRSHRALAEAERRLGLLRKLRHQRALVHQLKEHLAAWPEGMPAEGSSRQAQWLRRMRRLVAQLERLL